MEGGGGGGGELFTCPYPLKFQPRPPRSRVSGQEISLCRDLGAICKTTEFKADKCRVY